MQLFDSETVGILENWSLRRGVAYERCLQKVVRL